MTLGTFLPLAAILIAVTEAAVFALLRNRLPGRTEQGYDGNSTDRLRRVLGLALIASALAPVVLYVVLNLIVPEAGETIIF